MKKLKTTLLSSAAPFGLSVLFSLGAVPTAMAQTTDAAPSPEPASKGAAESNDGNPDQTPAAPTGIWERPNLCGDMGGLRPLLGKYGITLNLQETSEYLNNCLTDSPGRPFRQRGSAAG